MYKINSWNEYNLKVAPLEESQMVTGFVLGFVATYVSSALIAIALSQSIQMTF